jgi:hypothetical protein
MQFVTAITELDYPRVVMESSYPEVCRSPTRFLCCGILEKEWPGVIGIADKTPCDIAIDNDSQDIRRTTPDSASDKGDLPPKTSPRHDRLE